MFNRPLRSFKIAPLTLRKAAGQSGFITLPFPYAKKTSFGNPLICQSFLLSLSFSLISKQRNIIIQRKQSIWKKEKATVFYDRPHFFNFYERTRIVSSKKKKKKNLNQADKP